MLNKYQQKYQWPNLGNKNLVDFLDKSISSGKLAQTYVFAGLEHIGKHTTALAFAANLLVSDGKVRGDFSAINSDLHVLEREEGKRNISVEAVRDFIKKLSLSSFLNSYKIGIIKEAESLSLEAANALLKTLEEPREKVIVIMLTSTAEALPATLLSRAQVLYFYPLSQDEVYDYLIQDFDLKRNEAKDIAALAAGRPLLARKFAQDEQLYQRHLATAKVFVNFFQQGIVDRLKSWSAYLSIYASPLRVDTALDVLDNWQRVLRDLVLININCPELVQHSALQIELENGLSTIKEEKGQQSSLYLLELTELLKMSRKYILANVVPVNVIEQVIYNL